MGRATLVGLRQPDLDYLEVYIKPRALYTGLALLGNITVGKLGLVAALFLMGGLSYLATTNESLPGDTWAIERLQEYRSWWLDDAAVAASLLAEFPIAIASVMALSLALLIYGRKADAVAILLILIPEGIGLGIKELVGRDRPGLSLLVSPPDTPSFPSGHAVHALLLFGMLMFVLAGLVKPLWLRTAMYGGLGFMILACGASRVYLGVHWPSDVIGGFLLGAISAGVLLWVRKKLLDRVFQ